MLKWKLVVVGSRLNWMKVLGTYMITSQNGIRSSNAVNMGSFYKGNCSTMQTSNSMLRRSLKNFCVFKYVIKGMHLGPCPSVNPCEGILNY